MRTGLSLEAEATRRPSGRNAAEAGRAGVHAVLRELMQAWNASTGQPI
jgi:hypothetical protein